MRIIVFPGGLPVTQPEGSVAFASNHVIGEGSPLIVEEVSRSGPREDDVGRSATSPTAGHETPLQLLDLLCQTRRSRLAGVDLPHLARNASSHKHRLQTQVPLRESLARRLTGLQGPEAWYRYLATGVLKPLDGLLVHRDSVSSSLLHPLVGR